MNTFDHQYKKVIQDCLDNGFLRSTYSGMPAHSVMGRSIEHDMSAGFPLCTLRRLPEKAMRVETEFYLKGYTNKSWLTDRGCNFWNHWSNPNSKDPDDLGPTYGFEWRHFGADYVGVGDYSGKGIDQITILLKKFKKWPNAKSFVVSQWNPKDLAQQRVTPCPFAFQILKYGDHLNLIFYQRSADVCIGLPNDFAQHALLLHLFCLELGYLPGKVVGMFGQLELYRSHEEGAKELLLRQINTCPVVRTSNFKDIFGWTYTDTQFESYIAGEKIHFPIEIN